MYFKYLKYVLRHKWFVFIECCKLGVPFRGIMHDMSKFMPDEFIPYARYFYGNYKSYKELHGDQRLVFLLSNCLSKEDVKKDFDIAWLKHQKRNPHHWQWWILHLDDGWEKILEMPDEYIKEMVADWRGAGKAIHGFDDVANWYAMTKDKKSFGKQTREKVDKMIKEISNSQEEQRGQTK